MRSFRSDNNSGIHPKVFDAIAQANFDHAVAYGNDPITERALKKLKQIFGEDSESYFVLTGTAANILSVAPLVRSFNSVICSSFSHISFDESTGPETFTGCKFIPIESENAKLTVEDVKRYLGRLGDPHGAQPKVISITQPNEYGMLYTPEEVRSLAKLAHENGLLLHMDGSRLSNACAALGLGLKEATKDLGVNVLSFGGTKNGLMLGEVVVFFKNAVADSVPYFRKSLAQLTSKMRFIAAQFEAYLIDDLWLKNARQANQMAQKLSIECQKVNGFKLSRPTETNMVYGILDSSLVTRLSKEFPFYMSNPEKNESRFVTSFDTTDKDIELFIQAAKG